MQMNREKFPTSLVFFHFIVLVSMEQVVYIRTAGQRDKSEEMHPSPSRISCMSCIGKCKSSPLCYCLRVSAKGTCEYFTDKNQPSEFALDGFVYYVADSATKGVSTDNVALKKPAQQSSVYIKNGNAFSAGLAVDGNRNTDTTKSPYFAHTSDKNGNEKTPWWQVDLEDDYLIVAVRILSRDGYEFRLHDFQIRVGFVMLDQKWNDKVFEENTLCIDHPGDGIGSAQEVKFFCEPCPVLGRYVSVQIVRYCDDCPETSKNILQLAEVDVYGKKLY